MQDESDLELDACPMTGYRLIYNPFGLQYRQLSLIYNSIQVGRLGYPTPTLLFTVTEPLIKPHIL
jgi:hypothetical protein